MKKKPEILAPAGSIEAISAAINAGADGVYFGGKTFNARQNAKNMTEEEIKTAVQLCRLKEVKVYVTLNILIKNSELKALIKTLNFFKNLEIDGLIVQDPGVIYLLQKYFPEFKLQTSTQASVYGLEGVLFFEELGFFRVVLPREMPLSEVKKLKENAQIELKIFCHGALCYAYSGQCLMSSQIGGRSGNRGLCAQPCRKKYTLENEQGEILNSGYLLSPKDLNTLENMEAILLSGVDSLKIEGRMKGPEYVYGITRAYREKVDALLGEGLEKTMDTQSVMQVFNRDFTAGHLFNVANSLNAQVGKNRGILIGKVVTVKLKKQGEYKPLGIQLNSKASLFLGDGLSFGEDGKLGTKVDGIFCLKGKRLEMGRGGETVLIPCRHGVKAGTLIYKNFDKVLMERLKNEGSKPIKADKLIVDIDVMIKAKVPVEMFGRVNDNEIRVVSEIIPEVPLKNPLDQALVKEQLSRLGETSFVLGTLKIDLDESLFLSRGQLNFLRKNLIEKLEATFKKKKVKKSEETRVPLDLELSGPKRNSSIEKKRVSLELSQIPSVEFLNAIAEIAPDEIVLPLFLSENEKLKEIITHLKSLGIESLIALPAVMDTAVSKKIKEAWPSEKIKELGVKGVLIRNYEALHLYQNKGLYLEADQSMHIFNGLAGKALSQWGVHGGIFSLELDAKQIKEISKHSPLSMGLAVYGAQKLMVSKKCLFNCPEKGAKTCLSCLKKISGTLVDERGKRFFVKRDELGTLHLYNGDPLFLREELLDLKEIKTWRIYYREESAKETKKILHYYHEEIYRKNLTLETLEKTRGSFKRGVK